MIPYDIDPSLHTAEPEPQQLNDGFSAPHHETTLGEKPQQASDAGGLGDKSPF